MLIGVPIQEPYASASFIDVLHVQGTRAESCATTLKHSGPLLPREPWNVCGIIVIWRLKIQYGDYNIHFHIFTEWGLHI